MQDAQQERLRDMKMQASLGVVLDDPVRSSPEFAAAAVAWAQSAEAKNQTDEDNQKLRKEALCTAALVAVRDGNAELRMQHATWIRDTFARAMRTKDDSVHWMRGGLRFNPVAIAFVGMILLLKDRTSPADLRATLEVSARDNPAAAHGFVVAADTLATIDERLPRAVLRCALAARIRPSRGAWDEPKKKAAERSKQHQQRIKAAIEAEFAWLGGKRAEPEWPQFPLEPARPKHRLYIPGCKPQHEEPVAAYVCPDEYVEHQGAALWIRSAARLYDVAKRPWLRDVARTYSTWTMAANGVGLDPNDDVDHPPREWNDAYFNLLAYCLPGLDSAAIDEFALAPIISLPDESFFDAIAALLRSVDEVYFNDKGLHEAQAILIRATLARRMMTSRGWQRLARDQSYNIEMHIAPAIAVLFFNNHLHSLPPSCYLFQKGIDKLDPFLPVLQELAADGPCLFLALVILNLVEVSPRAAHLPFVVASGKAWLTGYPDDSSFWIDHGIGRRWCLWVGTVLNLDPGVLAENQVLHGDIELLLAGLVRVGVSEAHNLEKTLAERKAA
ncbi:MAG: hypothetical protein KBA75_10965 [Alphaproteobacteria bacterium]|nr:hypothetical protein [Alphaproteobacteria bacterium]